MSKKKTKKTKLFSDILVSNKKDIMVMKGDKEMSIAEASIQSAEESILVPADGVIPISGDELAKKKKTQSFTVGARYSKPIFTLYENGIKSANTVQTLFLTVSTDALDFLFSQKGYIGILKERTNINMILNLLDKKIKKLNRWIDNEQNNDVDTFIIYIPDIILFTDSIKKKEISRSIVFNLCIQVCKTKKKAEKLFDKKPDKFHEINHTIRQTTIDVARNLGLTSLNIPINDSYSMDIYDTSTIVTSIIEKEVTSNNLDKVIDSITFITGNSNDFITYSNILNSSIKKLAESNDIVIG